MGSVPKLETNMPGLDTRGSAALQEACPDLCPVGVLCIGPARYFLIEKMILETNTGVSH